MSLRIRLTLLLTATLAAALGAVFVLTYRGTGNDVLRQIDQDLRQDSTSLDAQGISIDVKTPRDVEQAVRNYVDTQPSFGNLARLYIVKVRHGPVITNEPELVGLAKPLEGKLTRSQAARMRRDAHGLLHAPNGYSTHETREAGSVRLLVFGLQRGNRTVASVAIGEPLAAVARAKAGVARTFLLTGAVALLIAGIGGWVVASRTSRPLRRIARTAAEIDGGRLGLRIRAKGPQDEVRFLADALDRMLDRLEDAFARQRGFVSDASHELRTPLTVVRGQLEVLARQEHPSGTDVRRVEGVVRQELLRMQRLVEDLLLLARADEGQLVRVQALDVDTFLADAWDPHSVTAGRDFRLGPGLPGGTLEADPDRIAQVISNLVRNAVAHTAEGGLVRLVARGHPSGLEIAVEDDGPGIPVEQRTRIFDRFHRADAGRARDSGGAGLGLAIAKAIVEAHGGTIAAGEAPAGGARVSFVLPRWTPGPAGPPARTESVFGDVPVVGRQR